MKRIITLFLAFLLAAMVAACAGSSDSVTGKNTQNENSTQSPTVDISESEPPAETEKQTESSGAAQEPETEEQRILVVYFSCTGNTAPLAEYVAEITGAGLYEITAEVPYTDDDIAYQISGCRANTEQKDAACRPAISGTVVDIQNYNVIFVAFPIWWGEEPRIIDTFMESYDFSGKTIIPFCTSGGSGISTAESNLHAMTDNTVQWLTGVRFAPGASKETMQEWIDGLGIMVS